MELQRTRSDNEGSQRRPRVTYGSRPPERVMSDAEVSQWLLEAEQEDRRLAAIERAEKRRVAAEKFGLGPSTDKRPAPADHHPRFHRGCKYRLPSADPIAIPTVPYDPLDKRWRYQDLRRRQGSIAKKVPKKDTKALRELAENGFEIQFFNDVEDDLDDNDFGEKDGKQCPICSLSPEAVNQVTEIVIDQVTEIAIDQVTEVAVDQGTEIAVDQDIEIGVDAAAIITSTNPATQDTQAGTITAATGTNATNRKNRIDFCLPRFLNIRRRSSVH